ncbi:MAG: DUF3619 family protein [Betaproteobacteria bacterium]|nr:DUF3619 family protein [Betaproteobacteria bacterium]
MNETHFGFRIKKFLNRGTRDLGPAVMERLRVARECALARQKIPVVVPMPACAGGAPAFLRVPHFSLFPHFPMTPLQRHVLAALLFCAAIIMGLYGYSDYRVQAMGEIEIALLSDDMPVEAFVDKGFEEWLSNSH